MDDTNHDDNTQYRMESTIGICYDDDRNAREDGAEDGDESEYKYDECERDDEWEWATTMHKAHDDESECRHEGIDQCDEGLCSEDEPES